MAAKQTSTTINNKQKSTVLPLFDTMTLPSFVNCMRLDFLCIFFNNSVATYSKGKF